MSLHLLDFPLPPLVLAGIAVVLVVLGVAALLFALAAWGVEPEAVECEWDGPDDDVFRGPGAPMPGVAPAAPAVPA